MSDNAKNKKQLNLTAALTAFSGLSLSMSWILIAAVSVFDLSAGLIIHFVLTGVCWIQLTNLDRTSKLSPLVWAVFVPAMCSGVVAYTLSLASVSITIVSLLVGIVGGGGLLVLTTLLTGQSKGCSHQDLQSG